ncbi:holin [Mycobacterium phage CRB2]|uniref:Holin n=1 Tax=Mycobacterium phage CRB2 TaxID=2483623 RepID=A0A455LLZ5_9CAUD|nr:holin [Mycobacterium phage CRB2]AYP70004.1 hypothetical protein CRB2_18 [Mycobacterium phage CRB2]
MTSHQSARAWLQAHIPPADREILYRVVAGALTFLSGWGILDNERAVLWSQLGIGTVTALFALLYATSSVRVVLYTLVGPLGAVLLAYGIIQDEKWAVITASLAQVFGIATAAAKTVEMLPPERLSGVVVAPAATKVKTAVAVRTPKEARAVRRARPKARSTRRSRTPTG